MAGESILQIDLTDAVQQQIDNELKKVLADEYSTETSEYVMLLIKGKHSKNDIVNDLLLFGSDKAIIFADFLFDLSKRIADQALLEEKKKAAPAPVVAKPAPVTVSKPASSVVVPKKVAPQQSTQAPVPVPFEQKKPVASQPKTITLNKSVPKVQKTPVAVARVRQQIMQDAVSPGTTTGRKIIQLTTASGQKRKLIRLTDENGNDLKNDTSSSEQQGNKKRATVFNVTLTGKSATPQPVPAAVQAQAPHEVPAPTEEASSKYPKIRCQYFPNCTRGNACVFFHPSEPCPYFPKCHYSNKCLYLHPSIPCKFQSYCTNPNCPYEHTAVPPRGRGRAAPWATAAPRNSARINAPCRFGPACTAADCKFMHPGQTSEDRPAPPLCRFGVNCTNPTCYFSHPEQNTPAISATVTSQNVSVDIQPVPTESTETTTVEVPEVKAP